MSTDRMAVIHQLASDDEDAFDVACERERGRMEADEDLWTMVEREFGDRIQEVMTGAHGFGQNAVKGFLKLSQDIDRFLDKTAASNVAGRN